MSQGYLFSTKSWVVLGAWLKSKPFVAITILCVNTQIGTHVTQLQQTTTTTTAPVTTKTKASTTRTTTTTTTTTQTDILC